MGKDEHYSTQVVTQRWLRKQWAAFDGIGRSSMSLKDFKTWLAKINLKLPAKEAKALFNKVT